MSVIIDQTALAALAALQRPGRPDIMARVLTLFRDDSPRLIEAIMLGAADADPEATRVAAHTLKSSSAYVGAQDLSATCAAIERAAKAGALDECAQLAATLDDRYQQTLVALDALDAPDTMDRKAA